MSIDVGSMLKTIDELRRLDSRYTVFGSNAHKYQLNEKLQSDSLEDFEKQHRIGLPKAYRDFLIEIGNGGAGPGYGLFPFNFFDNRGVGILSEPFPYLEAWNVPKAWFRNLPDPYVKCRGKIPQDGIRLREKLKMMRELRDELEFQKLSELRSWYYGTHHVNGAFPISHYGCKIYIVLIVNGSCKGEIWVDDRSSDHGVYPLTTENGIHHTFDSWYLHWLRESRASINSNSE